MNKRGVSPAIATVLLVAIVIVIAMIVFLWFKSMSGEIITKFGGTNIELVCERVEFNSQYVNGQLFIANSGNVPIFGMKVKIEKVGEDQTKDIRELSANWPDIGLSQGKTFSANIDGEVVEGAETIVLTPILLGTSDKGEKAYMCDEAKQGYVLEVF